MTDIVWIASSCVLILAVIAVRAAFGKKLSAGLRYALWGLVLLRLLVPGTIGSAPVSVKSAVQSASIVRDIETVRDYSAIAQTENGAVIGPLKRTDTKPAQEPEAMPGLSAEPAPTAEASESVNTAVVMSKATPEQFSRMRKTLAARLLWAASFHAPDDCIRPSNRSSSSEPRLCIGAGAFCAPPLLPAHWDC